MTHVSEPETGSVRVSEELRLPPILTPHHARHTGVSQHCNIVFIKHIIQSDTTYHSMMEQKCNLLIVNCHQDVECPMIPSMFIHVSCNI